MSRRGGVCGMPLWAGFSHPKVLGKAHSRWGRRFRPHAPISDHPEGSPMARVYSEAWRFRSARKSQRVTPAMMRRLRSYGSPESVEPGAHLFQQGERLLDLFVVVQGELE